MKGRFRLPPLIPRAYSLQLLRWYCWQRDWFSLSSAQSCPLGRLDCAARCGRQVRVYSWHYRRCISHGTDCYCLKKTVHEQDNEQGQSLAFSSVIGEGQADILAVTSCPSGVAHTFLAAKSLEKAACLAGVKIKVETQGANGIINRITAKDVQRAKLVIFAHDVAIKEPERFKHIKVIDVTTKDAILNAAALVQIKR